MNIMKIFKSIYEMNKNNNLKNICENVSNPRRITMKKRYCVLTFDGDFQYLPQHRTSLSITHEPQEVQKGRKHIPHSPTNLLTR